ncbi:hypothetical protein N7468_001431 [Penicillium chermesinum]|uniref:Ketoreductase domain-containing protein n=1 Tax=Penicillium chermesinum TaxID=63820 RepID=A0A9W9PIT6_9EURO|nr:uncharacterized protein N7468_001431 [Penicillium chermesinum]KAJ5246448.1 hypothetical protein N7468_001431 [Penicillium chermesinum]
MAIAHFPAPKRRNIFYQVDWKPDISALGRRQIEQYCSQQEPSSDAASLGGLASLLDIMAHKNSSMQILEIGAGTGSSTSSILSILNKQGKTEGNAPRYAKYVFTDHSPRFFEHARTRFARDAERVSFQMLNLHHSPLDQGFQAGAFDLVIAVDFFRGEESSPSEALKNARVLLKPDGYLVLLETTKQEEPLLSGIWNTIRGWWAPKEIKVPARSANEWERSLKEAGFAGLDAAISPFGGFEEDRNCLVARQPGAGKLPQMPETLSFVVKTEDQKKLTRALSAHLKSKGLPSGKMITLDSLIRQDTEFQADACISLLEYGTPFITNMDHESYQVLKRIVLAFQKLYWVTSGASEIPSVPENAMSYGFSRAMILENPGHFVCSINVEGTDYDNISKNLTTILQNSYGVSALADWEFDYDVAKGFVEVPRVTEANHVNRYVYSQTGGFTRDTPNAQGIVPRNNTQNAQYSFDSNASYVIAGGLGGAGRSLARYLATRGAKHLILLSRSGAATDDAKRLVEELTLSGVNVATPKCDISKREVLEGVIAECSKTMPPIKGAVQGTMVLSSGPFQNLTFDACQTVLQPKIAGTWNLHHVLPKNMDFYIILATLGGTTGTINQAVYSGTATFQDAFARHLWAQGQKCISIDIGILNSVGYVAERPEQVARFKEFGHVLLEETELQSVVDWACNPALKLETPWETQVLTGIDRPGAMRKRGKKPATYMGMPHFRHLREDEREIV